MPKAPRGTCTLQLVRIIKEKSEKKINVLRRVLKMLTDDAGNVTCERLVRVVFILL